MRNVSRVTKSSRKTVKAGKGISSKILSCSPEKKKSVNANRARLAIKRTFFKKVATKYHKEISLILACSDATYYQAVSKFIKKKGLKA